MAPNDLPNALVELEGHFAYDQGAVDSGVHDAVRRQELAKIVDAADEGDLRWALSRFIRNAYLSEAALQRGYGWEDALEFARWFDEGGYR